MDGAILSTIPLNRQLCGNGFAARSVAPLHFFLPCERRSVKVSLQICPAERGEFIFFLALGGTRERARSRSLVCVLHHHKSYLCRGHRPSLRSELHRAPSKLIGFVSFTFKGQSSHCLPQIVCVQRDPVVTFAQRMSKFVTSGLTNAVIATPCRNSLQPSDCSFARPCKYLRRRSVRPTDSCNEMICIDAIRR